MNVICHSLQDAKLQKKLHNRLVAQQKKSICSKIRVAIIITLMTDLRWVL